MNTVAQDDAYRVVAEGRDERYSDRGNALRMFQSLVYDGTACEVWEVYAGNSGVKIADFPGLT